MIEWNCPCGNSYKFHGFTEVEKLKEIIEEQRLSLRVLNDILGGEVSTTTENILAHSRGELKRKWVGLTPQERDEINQQVYGAVPHHVAFHHAIEAKLKEKNT